MQPIRIPRSARLLASGALLVGVALLLIPPSPQGRTGAGDPTAAPPAGGDPFLAAGVDPPGAPRVLLPRVHSVADAVETDGGWIVLDVRNDRIHAVDRSGRLRWSAGGEGQGPGELARPVALTVADSTVVVAGARGTSLDRFDLAGRFLDRVALRATDCMGNLVRGIAPWPGGSVVLLRLCLEPGTGSLRIRADRIDARGAAATLASLPLKDLRRPGDDLLATGVMATRGDTLYLGVTSERCVRVYEGTGAGGSVCLPPTSPVPIPEEERRKLDRALERRPLARTLGLTSPESLPPFDRIFAPGAGVVFRVLTSVEGRALVRVRPDGTTERISLPATEHSFVGSRSLLVSWQEPEGTALRIVALPGGPER